MRYILLKFSIPLVLVTLIVACAGGGAGFAGIGGSGFISTGTVTGFGSVFVNGVEFETGSAVFEIEDARGSEQQLRIGMVVQVQGSVNADGVSGIATGIRYADELEGPVTAISENADGNIKTLTILGNTVVVDTGDTVFENLTYASLTNNQVVEVSGFYDANGVLQASYVELRSLTYNASSQFEIKGAISGFSSSGFSLRGVDVDSSGASFSDLPNGLQDGIRVEVQGTYSPATNTMTATRIEGYEIEFRDDGSEISIEGYITRYTNSTDFNIDGYPVNASGASLEPASLQLALGVRVEAEGSVSNGVLYATEIEGRAGVAEVTAPVYDVDESNDLFRVEVLPGQYVIVRTGSSTLMKDDVGEGDSLSLTELVAGDFVELRGSETAAGTITATRVKRLAPEGIHLQGVVTAQTTDTSVTVLGVEFPVDASSTDYEDEFEVPLTDHADFIGHTVLDQSIISIVDKQAPDGNASGVADGVEIEIP